MNVLVAYLVLLIAIGILDWRRAGDWNEYVLAGRSKSALAVTLSILASVVGASATMAVVDMAYRTGFPAFWWLAVGAVGLLVQAGLLSRRVRNFRVSTLPDLAERVAGPWMRRVSALVVAAGWTGIVAAQFVAAAKVATTLSGQSPFTMTLITAAVITGYAVLGGQHSVFRTDMLQFGLLAAGLAWLLVRLYGPAQVPSEALSFEALNASFGAWDFMEFLFLVGGSYFICPIIFSRLFTARTARAAQRASLASGLLLLPLSLGITAIGLWAGYHMPGISGDVLTTVAQACLSGPTATLFFLALLSAIVSSADTCLLAVGSIVSQDLMGSRRIRTVRGVVLLTGLAATGIALKRQDIIGILLEAYGIFTAGLVPPLAAGLLARGRWTPHSGMLFWAAILGGGTALAGSALDLSWLPMAGLGISILVSVTACLPLVRQQLCSAK
jgi:SSS family solute:Na+ symporter